VTYERCDSIRISSASNVSVKKLVTDGSRRRTEAGIADCGGTTPVSIARPELPAMPKYQSM
jgi:hypothetical protein